MKLELNESSRFLNEDILSIEQINLLSLNELLCYYDFKEEYNQEKRDIKSEIFHNSGDIHGVSHAERVLFLVLAISHMEDIDEEDREMVMAGSKYHDIGRDNDNVCYNQGIFSSQEMKRMKILQEMTPKKKELIKYIIDNHYIDDEVAYQNIEIFNIEDKEK